MKNSRDLGKFSITFCTIAVIIQFIILLFDNKIGNLNLFDNFAIFTKFKYLPEIQNIKYYNNILWFNLFYYFLFTISFFVSCYFYTKKSLSKNNFIINKNSNVIKYLSGFMTIFGFFNSHYLFFKEKFGRFFGLSQFESFDNYMNFQIFFNFISSNFFVVFGYLFFVSLFLKDWRDS